MKYHVLLTDIQWVADDEDGQQTNLPLGVPPFFSTTVEARTKTEAEDLAVGEASDQYGFLVWGCMAEVMPA